MTNNDLLRLDGFKTIGTEKVGDGLIVDNRLDPCWDPQIVAEHGIGFLEAMYPLHRGHGIDLATFERDLAAGSF